MHADFRSDGSWLFGPGQRRLGCLPAVPSKLSRRHWNQSHGHTNVHKGISERSAWGSSAPRRVVKTCALFEQFTERSVKAVMIAKQEAQASRQSEVRPIHLLIGLMSADRSRFANYLGTETTVERARNIARDVLRTPASKAGPVDFNIGLNPETSKILENTVEEGRKEKVKAILTEHILLMILASNDATVVQTLRRLKVDLNLAKKAAKAALAKEAEEVHGKKLVAASRGGGRGPQSRSQRFNDALGSFCRDLVAEAQQQRIDPVIGRDKEVTRVTQILARRSKNNPILLGEPGTGKTAIAEGLAIQIARGMDHRGKALPEFLREKRILSLDVAQLMAGTAERGEFERRINGILEESLADGNVILVIDEVHQVVGAGAVGQTSGFASRGLDMGNLLKPALARGRLQVIGATTLKEFRQFFEKDAALERRFQPVMVGEPSTSEAISILTGLQEKYERHHMCVFTDQALEAAVHLSQRYITGRFLPDKAIDLLDEAGSRARISAFAARKQEGDGAQLDVGPYLELQQVLDAKAECAQEQRWEEASLLRSRETELKKQLTGPCYDLPAGCVVPIVEANDIAHVVSSWTAIPVSQMSEDDRLKIASLPQLLKAKVIGQDSAVDSISSAIKRARSGLADPKRPVASLLFCGPTGVGKTELAKVLASIYFGSEDAMVRLDMSEYMERHSISRLIGAPPGFVGYGNAGELTEAVKQKPQCLLVLDEIEKAHPDVFNLLLQVLEDGRLTDSKGQTIVFKHAMIVMTSNVGSSQIAGSSSLGFDLPSSRDHGEEGYSRMKDLVIDELKNLFRPEFLNRLDDIIVFQQLRMESVRAIADLLLTQSSARLLDSCVANLRTTGAFMSFLVKQGYDQEYGARPLRRAIVQLVEDPLADAILSHKIQPGDLALLDVDSRTGKVTITVKPDKTKPAVLVKSEIVAKRPKYGLAKTRAKA